MENTRIKKKNIAFDTNFLSSLVETSNSCVQLVNIKQHLALHSSQIETFEQSVKDELLTKVPKYDHKLNGIVLGYENIKVLNEHALISYDSAFLHCDVQGDFFVFQPQVGTILNGVVMKTSHDHVACLVYKSFNVSLPESECNDKKQWLGHNVTIGDEVRFKITFVDMELRFPYIRGKLISIISSVATDISPTEEDIQMQKNGINKEHKMKKHKTKLNNTYNSEITGHSIDDKDEQYIQPNLEDEEHEQTFKNKPKDKNKKLREVANNDITSDEEYNEPHSKRKKHKQLKNNSLQIIQEDEHLLKKSKSKNHSKVQKVSDINDKTHNEEEINDNTIEDTPRPRDKHKPKGSKLTYESNEMVSNSPKVKKVKKERIEEIPTTIYESVDNTGQKKNKKSKNKSDSFSSDDLALRNIFNDSHQTSNSLIADDEDRDIKRRKRSISLSQNVNSLSNIKLEPDSDWENILKSDSSRKRKRAVSESESPKKKKHKNSM